MANIDKIILKLKNQPNGIRLAELEKVLTAYGYILQRQTGSHRTYTKDSRNDIITIPNGNPVKAVYVKNIIKKLGL